MTAPSRPAEKLNQPSRREKIGDAIVVLLVIFPAAFLLIFFFVLPIFSALRYSLMSTMPFFNPHPAYTLGNYVRVITEPVYRHSFIRTGEYALVSTMISLLISYPVAYFLALKAKRGSLILLLLLIPFWTSVILRVFTWKVILGSGGILNWLLISIGLIDQPIKILYTGAGVIFGLIYTYTLFMVLPLYATLGKVPKDLLEASANLGANPLQTLIRITIPLTRSGTMSAVVLVMLACFGDVLSSQLLGGPNTLMISTVIFETFLGGANWCVGSALSVVVFSILLIISAVLVWIGREAKYA
jgi:ABC-type spermidine/putrescine transport system permease subunit I